eukprot:TRINITY_DN47025_c0_g1_i1.p1 TRINITY_DN47025_c0_g1~~TRINITY_DN47025_c0_g1_i1.p1  ORF type:complete len:433 (+),score=109.14 TRINITY_DN47025_c0_g1_i1:89-1387(+)
MAPAAEGAAEQFRRASNRSIGVVLIVLVACIWVAASQLIQLIYNDLEFDKPFFMTYFNTCGFSVWLLGMLCVPSWRAALAARSDTAASRTAEGAVDCPLPLLRKGSGAHMYCAVALSFCPAWMLANYLFNLSLDNTSVASNSVLSETSSLWTMLLSVCVLGERLDPYKVLSVFLAIGGSALVARADTHSGGERSANAAPHQEDGSSDAWGGDLLALGSAFAYGMYTVLLKKKLPEDSEVSMPVLFGFVGCVVLLTAWPVLLILDAAGAERFELPPGRTLGFLAINSFVGTNLSDVLWARAVVLTSPLVATLGLSLTIPFGMASDAIFRGKSFSAEYVGGAGLVLVGFVVVNLADRLWAATRRALGMPSDGPGSREGDCCGSAELTPVARAATPGSVDAPEDAVLLPDAPPSPPPLHSPAAGRGQRRVSPSLP